MKRIIWLSCVALLLAAAACGDDTARTSSGSGTSPSPSSGATSLAGTWNCLQPFSDTPDLVELEADGDLFITQGGQRNGPGKWTATGSSGSFNPGTPDEEKFTVQDGKIVFGDGTACTKKA